MRSNPRFDGKLKDHSGLELTREPDEWASLEAAHPAAAATRRDHRVLARPITDLLGSRNHVDLYALDVEGAELSILRNFPFEEVIVENWFVETNKLDRARFVEFMEGKGYACQHHDHVNSLCTLRPHRAPRATPGPGGASATIGGSRRY